MAIPDYETLMRPLLVAISEGARNISEALPRLKAEFSLTDDEAEKMLPSGRVTILASRAHWARAYLASAGCLTSPQRNVHEITARGRALLQSSPTRIDNATLTQFPEFVAWRKRQDGPNGSEVAASVEGSGSVAEPSRTPMDVIEDAHAEIETVLVADLLNAIQGLSPGKFEQLIVDLLIAMGYGGGDQTMGERIGRSGDGGIDGIIKEDTLGLDAIYVQAKRYALDSKVGRPALQAFVGSLTGEGATKGVFVTTSDFSRDARDYLNKVQHRIVLVNGERLARLMIQHEVGVRARRTYVLRSVDEDYFTEL